MKSPNNTSNTSAQAEERLLPANSDGPTSASSFAQQLVAYTRYWADKCSGTCLSTFFQFAAGATAWIQATFSYMVFTGLIDCDHHGKPRDEEYEIVYFSFMAVCFAINAPAVLYESWRKALKWASYYGRGTAKPPYARSSKRLKFYNSIMQGFGVLLTGWNLASMFGRFPSENSPEAHLDCVGEGWHMPLVTVVIGFSGIFTALLLAVPQVITYIGRKKPCYGPFGTAAAYAVYKIGMSCYPLIRRIVKDHKTGTSTLDKNSIMIKVLLALLVMACRCKVYSRANDVINKCNEFNERIDEPDIVNIGDTDIKKIKELKQGISTLEEKINDLNTELTQPRSKSCHPRDLLRMCLHHKDKLKELLAQLEAEKASYIQISVNADIAKQDLDKIEERKGGLIILKFMLALSGAVSSAYLQTLSLFAIADAMGADESSLAIKFIAYTCSTLQGNNTLIRTLAAMFGTLKNEPSIFESAKEDIIIKFNSLKSELGSKMPDSVLDHACNV